MPSFVRAVRLRAVIAVSVVACAHEAAAFCRVTTCDPAETSCDRDADGCLASGRPLYWSSGCVSIATQEDGSAFHGIDANELESLVTQALRTWMSVDCGGGETPSISVESLGLVACDRSEYNASGNANIVLIRDRDWPYPGSANTLGKTNVTFDPASGRIYDADIEINGADADLSVGDPVMGADLASIVMHEVGHFLGLDHSLDPNATMRADYLPLGSGLRTLGEDDERGICAVYPPSRKPESASCAPRHGFSAECGGSEPKHSTTAGTTRGGCSLAAPKAFGESHLVVVLASIGLAMIARRGMR